MQLTCRQCGMTIAPADIDIQAMRARCGRCGTVIDLREALPDAEAPAKYTVEPPDGFMISHGGASLVIAWSWISWRAWYALLFNVAWYGMLYLLFGATGIVTVNKIPTTFPIAIFFYIGLCLIYLMLVQFSNRTTICVDRRQIVVRHGPLPYSFNAQVDVDAVDQLYCEEIVFYGQLGYNVMAQLKSGRHVRLLSRLQHMNQAAYIEQQIEGWLGIVDQPVAGEMHWV